MTDLMQPAFEVGLLHRGKDTSPVTRTYRTAGSNLPVGASDETDSAVTIATR